MKRGPRLCASGPELVAGRTCDLWVNEHSAAPFNPIQHPAAFGKVAQALPDGPKTQLGPSPQFSLKDNRVLFHRRQVAVVAAQTRD